MISKMREFITSSWNLSAATSKKNTINGLKFQESWRTESTLRYSMFSSKSWLLSMRKTNNSSKIIISWLKKYWKSALLTMQTRTIKRKERRRKLKNRFLKMSENMNLIWMKENISSKVCHLMILLLSSPEWTRNKPVTLRIWTALTLRIITDIWAEKWSKK